MEQDRPLSDDNERRDLLKKCGRFAAMTLPHHYVVVDIIDVNCHCEVRWWRHRIKGNNGYDSQPCGNLLINDGPGKPGKR